MAALALAAYRRQPSDPLALPQPTAVVFAGEHAIAESVCRNEPTGEPPDQSTDQPAATGAGARRPTPAAEIASGAGPWGVALAAAGATAVVHQVGPKAAAIDRQDALTLDEVAAALQLGRDAADAAIDAGAHILIGAVCAPGAAIAAAAIGSHLTGLEPVDAVAVAGPNATAGPAATADPAADWRGSWSRQVAAVRDARYRLSCDSPDAASLLRVAGGADLAALTGLLLQAALRGVPVLLDDVPGLVAALLARRFAPGAERFLLPAGRPPASASRLQQRLLDLLDGSALLPWDLGAGPLFGSLAALGAVTVAAHTMDATAMSAPAATGGQ